MEQAVRLDAIPMETIDGKVCMMSPRPFIAHNIIIANLTTIFGNYLKGKPCMVFADGVDVHLDEKNVFVPDVMIVCNHDIIKPNALYGAPDLVVEVLSPSTAMRDRGPKMKAYAKASVKEYWIVTAGTRSVEVYLNQGGQFELDHVYEDFTELEWQSMDKDEQAATRQYIKVSLYDDLLVDIKEVFAKIPMALSQA